MSGAPDGRRLRPATLAVHAGAAPPEPGAPVVPPIVQSATFFGGRGEPASQLVYSRYGNNPNQAMVAEKVAALEGTEASLMLGSGMAATAMTVLAVCEAGDHVVASRYLYGATHAFLTRELPRRGVSVTFVDPDEPDAWEAAARAETRLLLIEVPTNPTLRVFDPRPAAAAARRRGAVLAMDATFASPVNARMAEYGVDAEIHSATKYLGGHSDIIAGVVSGSAELIERVRAMMKLYGPAPDPHAAWLLDRGLRTLAQRVAQQNHNALELARFFEGRPEVARVLYPGLESHPDHALARELLDGFGGVVSIVLAGGGAAADRMCDALGLALLAPSLGGVETLVSQPRYTSHQPLTPEEREAAG
ncbi:MAG: aminotransferase class I/II-fold pyridoxal phosphate-dependent enzyme, partial [Gemmatimonadetes bacterium]